MSKSIELFGPINLWCSEIRHSCWFFLRWIQMHISTQEQERPEEFPGIYHNGIHRCYYPAYPGKVFSAGALLRLVFEPWPGWTWKEKSGCCTPSRSSNQYWNNWCIRVPPPKKISSFQWRECIKKVWKIDPLSCPKCANEMKIISFIVEVDVIRKILEYLGLWEDTRLPLNAPTPPDLITEKN